MGGRHFVETQLISADDLYYSSQQKSTYLHENTVPVWRSVQEGNWNYVSGIVRKLGELICIQLMMYVSYSLFFLFIRSLCLMSRETFLFYIYVAMKNIMNAKTK